MLSPCNIITKVKKELNFINTYFFPFTFLFVSFSFKHASRVVRLLKNGETQ